MAAGACELRVCADDNMTLCRDEAHQITTSRDASFGLLSDQHLSQLCGSTCARDIVAARAAINNACTSATDVVFPGDDIAYPGTTLNTSMNIVQLLTLDSQLSCG